MSMEFTVELKGDIDLAIVLEKLQLAVITLLNIPTRPNIVTMSSSKQRSSLRNVGESATFLIEGIAEASLSIQDLPYDESDPLITKPLIVISAGSLRSELSWVCVIALAIVTADMQRTTITDDAHLIGNSTELCPKEIFEAIRLTHSQEDMLDASRSLLRKLGLL